MYVYFLSYIVHECNILIFLFCGHTRDGSISGNGYLPHRGCMKRGQTTGSRERVVWRKDTENTTEYQHKMYTLDICYITKYTKTQIYLPEYETNRKENKL